MKPSNMPSHYRNHRFRLILLLPIMMASTYLEPAQACVKTGGGGAPLTSASSGPQCVAPTCDKKKCFHPMTNLTNSGHQVSIASMVPGDRTLGARNEREPSNAEIKNFEEILGERQFVQINTNGGKTLTVTPEHVVYTRSTCQSSHSWSHTPADQVIVGQCLPVMNDYGSLTTDSVRSIGSVTADRTYRVVTNTGNIIANGVLVSCHDEHEQAYDESFMGPSTAVCISLSMQSVAHECFNVHYGRNLTAEDLNQYLTVNRDPLMLTNVWKAATALRSIEQNCDDSEVRADIMKCLTRVFNYDVIRFPQLLCTCRQKTRQSTECAKWYVTFSDAVRRLCECRAIYEQDLHARMTSCSTSDVGDVVMDVMANYCHQKLMCDIYQLPD